MKILVTGGAGFIASNYIRYLIGTYSDYEIINLDKLTYAGNLENLRDIESCDRYTFLKGDICDKDLLANIEFDVIVHFAAESHVDRSIMDATPFLQTNIIGTYNLLEQVRQRDCRFVHVSTDEVYGSIEDGLFNEKSPLLPANPYAASKASSDMLVSAYVETHKLKAMITRCSNNYGPFQFPEKLIPLFILNAVSKKSVPIYGDGMNVRDWIYVLDHNKAVDAVLHKGTPGEVYNIGSKNEMPNIELVKLLLRKVAEKLNQDPDEILGLISYVKDRKGHDRRYAIDPSKIESQLGWKPETDFEEGLSETIDWYLAHEDWWKRIVSGEYMEYYSTQYGKRLRKSY